MVKKTLEKFGKIDILINNAGRGYDAPIEKTNISKFRDLLELDLLGPLITMQKMIPVMRKQGGGVIINISSGTALMYLPNMGAYSSAKRALVGISLTARVELEHDKISVSVVYPYITQTDFEKNTLKDDLEEDRREWDKNIPTRDTPEYVADKILEVIKSGKAEIFAHDWMKPNK